MSYKDIIKTCMLLQYNEWADYREELWVTDMHLYRCHWFYSNEGECPNTMYKEVYALG